MLGPARLKMELDRNLWRDTDHIGTRRLWEYLCSYLYLPRLKDHDVCCAPSRRHSTVAASDVFAYAGGYERRPAGTWASSRRRRARDPRFQQLLVKPEAASCRRSSKKRKPAKGNERVPGQRGSEAASGITYPPIGWQRRRWRSPGGSSSPRGFTPPSLSNPDRVGRDAGKIADEILSHLSTLPDARLRVSIEIEAELPEGAPEDVQRTVSENAGVLKFDSHGFERE